MSALCTVVTCAEVRLLNTMCSAIFCRMLLMGSTRSAGAAPAMEQARAQAVVEATARNFDGRGNRRDAADGTGAGKVVEPGQRATDRLREHSNRLPDRAW